MSSMFCLRNWIFSSKRAISIIVRSSHQAWSNQRVRNEKPVVYNPIIIFSRTSAFPASARKIHATLAYLLSSAVVLHPLHFRLWWTRSKALKPGTCERCWPVCLWTYVTSEAQAVEHVSTIDRNMFCWSLQTPLSQCAMSGLTETLRASTRPEPTIYTANTTGHRSGVYRMPTGASSTFLLSLLERRDLYPLVELKVTNRSETNYILRRVAVAQLISK